MSSSIRQSNLFAAADYQKVFQAYQFIDYTAYDFDTLKQALINYIQTYYPEDFNDYIESSEFIALIELIAYLGTSLAFRTDLNSRENFIDTATRRQSIIQLAQMVNYVPSRNVCASGLFKIAAVETDQLLTDASGVNLNNVTVFWNDPNNEDWFDQFVQICNAAFSTLNPFGRPTQSGTIGSIPTDLYQLNSVTNINITYPTSCVINGQTYPIDICNPNFITNQTIFERAPDPSNPFNFIYRNDSLGVGSSNTGFFLYFKQGAITNVDTNFNFPVPSTLFPIDIQNINQSDVYAQQTDQAGNVLAQWVMVPQLAGQNIIYNSIANSVRNIYSVITGLNDTITVAFADGNFGNVPTGLFRFWVRVSANQNLVIQPSAVQNQTITIPYIGVDQQQYNLTVTFTLEQTIGNAAASETNEQIQLRAPEVFSTQDRMANGSDYNILPLIYGNQIAKLQAIDRTYSGMSRYIDLNDPTGFHRDLIIFGQDGALYREDQDIEQQITENGSNSGNIDSILLDAIQQILTDPTMTAFYLDAYLPQFENVIQVDPPAPIGAPGTGGRSLLDLVPAAFPITTIAGNGTTVVVNYTGPTFPAGTAITISGVTGVPAYNGTYTILTSGAGTLSFTSATTGTAIVTNATVSDDPTLPLFWKTSPMLFKNDTGYFTNNTATNAPAAILVNTLDPNNIPDQAYQPWAFIQPGSVLEFAPVPNVPLNTVSVDGVIQNGLPTIVNPLNPYANIGPVSLSEDEQNNLQALKVYPPFRNALTSTEIANVTAAINAGVSFYMYYDLLSDEWGTSTAFTAGLTDQSQQPFVYPSPNIVGGIEQIYSNWTLNSSGGLLYVNIATNNSTGIITYTLTGRGRVYVFQSLKSVQFYWEPNEVIIDNATGLALQDNIEVMPFINTNSSIDNNEPVITNPTTAFLTNEVTFNISGVVTQPDGYVDNSFVQVSLIDTNADGIPDDPEGFDDIVSPTDRIVFEYYINQVTGYQTSQPWVTGWNINLENSGGLLYVYFPVSSLNNTVLYSAPYIADQLLSGAQILNPSSVPGLHYAYMDSANLFFINNLLQITFDPTDPATISIPNQLSAFFNNTGVFPWIPVTDAGPILEFGVFSGGSGYVNSVYTNVPLTGGSGTGATGDFTVSGAGVVTVFSLVSPGINYVVGDILSVSNVSLGGSGGGFNIPVTIVESSSVYYVAGKSGILTDYFFDASFLIYSISPPGYGVYEILTPSTTDNLVAYPTGQIVIGATDPNHYDKNGKVFTQNTTIPTNEQLPFYFKWSHYSPIDQVVDPSATNIIDMIVITDSYYQSMLNWAAANGTLLTMPEAPTTEDLRVQFQNLDQYKMISDNMIWNSGNFLLLFGPQAAPELQANFVVVPSPGTTVTNNQISTLVINAVNAYFDIRNWDFGETFYFSELAAFIHQQLITIISTIVIVPTSTGSTFGNLFEIVCGPTQLFLSTATVNNVQIVTTLTNQNLNIQ
jgi:hypothetical protein